MAYYDIGEVFQIIEEEMISSMSRNLKRHLNTEKKEGLNYSMWQAEQLAALNEFKMNNSELFGSYFSTINDQIEEVLQKANASGLMDQEAEILKAIREGWSTGKKAEMGVLQGSFFKINDRKLKALIKATTSDMTKAETAMLRMAHDQYRKIIFNAEAYYNTGAGTLAQCVDMATKDFLAKGITCIEYANGARVGIDAYSRMALRTAQTRAYLQGESTKRDEWGINTVIVNRRGVACPLCLQYVGKVFYDDVWGSAPVPKPEKYPRLSEAVAGGLYHPNCKDIHTTYFEGISRKPVAMTQEQVDEANRVYALEQEQRYNERQIRKYKRLVMGSADPENVLKYRQKLTYWKDRQAEFVKANSDVLKRRPELEKIFQLPEGLQYGHNSYTPPQDFEPKIDPCAKGHTWVETITKQPKCEEPGEKLLKCSVCGEAKTVEIPALGHDMKPHIVPPTCTKDGYTRWICDRKGCLHSYTTDVKPALGHDYGDWVVTRQPTVTEVGRKQRFCKRCGKVSYSTIPKLKGGAVTQLTTPNVPRDYNAEAQKIIHGQQGMTPGYEKVVTDHFATGSEAGKKAFIKYVPSNSVADSAYTGTAHYSPWQKKVNMDFGEDLTNARGAGTTFFHEHGHYIDFTAKTTPISHDQAFKDALKADFENYIKIAKKAHNVKTKPEAYTKIASELWSHETHAISDLCGGLSKNKAQGRYGHRTSYWDNPLAVPQEAFAHMFDAEFNPTKRALMEKYFPTAFARFEELLGGLV